MKTPLMTLFLLVAVLVFSEAHAAEKAGKVASEVANEVAGEVDCTACHADLTQGKSVHAAVQMGCTSCHSGLDARDVPHKVTKGVLKGLTAEQPDLCYGCHERAEFFGPTVHAPVGVGTCTACHNPHRSDNDKLLISGPTELCFMCHDKGGFKKATIHKPVETGECLQCHGPHASQNDRLLRNKGNLLCRKCHPDVVKKPHAVAGFKRAGHPLSGRKDPIRAGKTFECLSCHVGHSSEWPSLYRYQAKSPFELCMHCHQM